MCQQGFCEHHYAPEDESSGATGRRAVLRAGTALGAGAALALAPLSFAEADEVTAGGVPAEGEVTRVISGHLDTGVADFVYLPVEVPRGVNQIAVSYTYSKPSVPAGTPGNSCDIGIFDERGTELGGRGFRGWSGGARTSFVVNHDSTTTPGYLPGPVNRGTWHVVLGPYQVAPQGMDYTVTVTLRYGAPGAAFVPDYPATRAKGRGRAWYRGDAHLHTVHSDGKRLPSEVAAGARAAGLDFMISTDHNTSSSHGVWGEQAGQDLLIITGEEVTTRNGHWLALGLPAGSWIDWRYRARDGAFSRFAKQVHRLGGLVVPAHPYCPYIASQWKFGYAEADAVEVWNGPWTYDDESAVDTWDALLGEAMRRGDGWQPAIGNSDAHSEPQVIGLPHTVVNAENLNRDAILDGIRSGRSWIAESSSVSVAFTATGRGRVAGIGETLRLPSQAPVDVRVEVAGVPDGTVRLITDEGQMHQESLDASGAGTVVWRTTASLAAYVRAEVRHPLADGTPGKGNTMAAALQWGPMAALTNPILLRSTDSGH
ncbi:CehA/McbA family metallohydrolase [Streptomyces sp. AK02-01A]|uniref:CehA/McbA family metallohydrolase n=1 Tax=Streptomyces sp. AK02-01A TaxID=3028648 RepID=UPI0029B71E89|nr:CehA/McbA family metallohydrolase [Streptomyces sp. AK02-01A]MDX3855192.1 CehA/McbA family metallohydrolase [Streptomyces sp. AK02-01A]